MNGCRALMTDSHEHHKYHPTEEALNVYSHALGLALSVVALLLLLIRAHGVLEIVSASVFATSMIALYSTSMIYHNETGSVRRARLRIIDHAMIYILIAGTYTPFSLLVLKGAIGWTIFGVSWTMAAVGIVIKLAHTGRYDKISTAMYVLMGWIIVIAIKPLIAGFSTAGLLWLFSGGISYTLGALFYSFKKMPYGHASFHIFCLLGSACHFVALYFFVLAPSKS